MGMEGPKINTLSPEQQEKAAELSKLFEKLFDSFDSNEAYETTEFYRSLKSQKLNPEDFYLWNSVILNEDNAPFQFFDTEDGQIEKFIRNLVRK